MDKKTYRGVLVGMGLVFVGIVSLIFSDQVPAHPTFPTQFFRPVMIAYFTPLIISVFTTFFVTKDGIDVLRFVIVATIVLAVDLVFESFVIDSYFPLLNDDLVFIGIAHILTGFSLIVYLMRKK